MYMNSIDFFNLTERWSWCEGLGDVTINMSLGPGPRTGTRPKSMSRPTHRACCPQKRRPLPTRRACRPKQRRPGDAQDQWPATAQARRCRRAGPVVRNRAGPADAPAQSPATAPARPGAADMQDLFTLVTARRLSRAVTLADAPGLSTAKAQARHGRRDSTVTRHSATVPAPPGRRPADSDSRVPLINWLRPGPLALSGRLATQCHWHAVVKLRGQHNHQPHAARRPGPLPRCQCLGSAQTVLAHSPRPVWHSSLTVALISGS